MLAFGVGQGTEPFPALNPQSVSLPLTLSQRRFDCGQFRSEPAITGFDRLITPNLRLHKRLHTELLRASTPFYGGFTLPKIRSPGFGSYSCDYMALSYHPPHCLRGNRFPFAYLLNTVMLATQIYSLTRYSKRTIDLLRGLSYYNY